MRTIQTAEVFNAIYQRRATRSYTGAAVEHATIAELIDAAIQAPSAMNAQPWAFVVLTGADRLSNLSQRIKTFLSTYAELASPELRQVFASHENLFYGAPALVIVCATATQRQAAEDCAMAAQNFMLAAFACGLATCPIGLARPWLERPEVKAELGIPADLTPVVPLALGYTRESPPSPGRRAPRIIEL